MSYSSLLDYITDPDRCKFVEKPPEYLHIKCPVCLDILLPEPYLVSCCGNHFCKKCIDSLRKTDPCPLCKAAGNAQFKVPDKGLGRALNSLNIFCPNKDKSCDWEGTLGTVHQHLSTSCGFVLVPCKFKCDFSIMRQELELHETQRCPKRPQTCKHCKTYTSTYILVLQHEKICLKGTIKCLNQCGSSFAREDQAKHLEECPNVSIKCTFRHAGCSWVGPRGQYEEHLDSAWRTHISSITTHMIHVVEQQDEAIANITAQINDQDETIEALKSQVISLDIDAKKFKAKSIQMASRLSTDVIAATSVKPTPQVEPLALVKPIVKPPGPVKPTVKPPVTLPGPPTPVKPSSSVEPPTPVKPSSSVKPPAPVKLPNSMKPPTPVKLPDSLKPPAPVKLPDSLKPPGPVKLSDPVISFGTIRPSANPSSNLTQLNTSATLKSSAPPNIPQATAVVPSKLLKKFIIQQFHQKKKQAGCIYSPTFTLCGYTMQLTFYMNGVYEGEGHCISIFLNMMSKEHSKWKASKYKPVNSSLTVRLQSQFPTKFAHHDKMIHFKTDAVDIESFMSPVGTKNGKPVFIKHTELAPYLQNDQLHFQLYS